MTYKELLNLGFERNECLAGDTIWFDRYGYNCFFLEYHLVRHKKTSIRIDWSPDTRKLTLIHFHEENVITRREITEKEMCSLIKVFKREGDLPNGNTYQIVA